MAKRASDSGLSNISLAGRPLQPTTWVEQSMCQRDSCSLPLLIWLPVKPFRPHFCAVGQPWLTGLLRIVNARVRTSQCCCSSDCHKWVVHLNSLDHGVPHSLNDQPTLRLGHPATSAYGRRVGARPDVIRFPRETGASPEFSACQIPKGSITDRNHTLFAPKRKQGTWSLCLSGQVIRVSRA